MKVSRKINLIFGKVLNGLLRFGVLNKVVLLFPTRWWDASHDTFGHIVPDDEEPGLLYLWYCVSEVAGGNLIASLVSGQAALDIEKMTDSDIMQLGQFELITISGGRYRIDGGTMFGVVPRVLWERQFEVDDQHRIAQCTHCLLVRTGQQTILIDTGYGKGDWTQ